MESDLSPLAEGISVTFHYLVVIMRHWDDNKGMERDPNLGNFCLSVGISQNGGGAPDDGLSDARHSIRCLAVIWR